MFPPFSVRFCLTVKWGSGIMGVPPVRWDERVLLVDGPEHPLCFLLDIGDRVGYNGVKG